MSRPAAVTWVCPVCGRRVPRREGECFCGAKQSQAEQHERREAERTTKRIPGDVAFFVVLLVLVAVYAVHRVARPEEGSAAASVPATPEPPLPPGSLSRSWPTSTTQPLSAPPPPSLPPAVTLAPVALARPVAVAPAATPAPVDERERSRAVGLLAYEAELGRLSSLASRLDENVGVYKRECGPERKFAYAVSNCPEIEATIKRGASAIQQGLDAAEDQARRAWVQPGSVREARARSFFGSRAWDELQSAASNPNR